MIKTRRLTPADPDLAEIAAELNTADWDASIKDFSEQSLQNFLADSQRFYLLAYDEGKVAGAIHGYCYPHPTGVKYVWVDEVDTMANHRRKGVAKAMMKEALKIAGEYGAAEAWLGTEHDNTAALALYEGLNPTEREDGPTYSWKINE